MNGEKPEPSPNDADAPGETLGRWTAFLARWVEFARAGATLPAGDEWRRAIVPVIELQAVTFAMADIGTLPHGDRAMAVDRAGVLVERNQRVLAGIWDEGRRPPGVTELLQDAWGAVEAARSSFPS